MEIKKAFNYLYILNLFTFVLIFIFLTFLSLVDFALFLLVLFGLWSFCCLGHDYGKTKLENRFVEDGAGFEIMINFIFGLLSVNGAILVFISILSDISNFNPMIIIISSLFFIFGVIFLIINAFIIKSLISARNGEKLYRQRIEQQKKAELLNKKYEEIIELRPNKILCSKCKKHYHNPEYNICHICYMCQEQGVENPEELAPCKYEKNGICNFVLEYDKCKKIDCSDYFPETSKNKS